MLQQGWRLRLRLWDRALEMRAIQVGHIENCFRHVQNTCHIPGVRRKDGRINQHQGEPES